MIRKKKLDRSHFLRLLAKSEPVIRSYLRALVQDYHDHSEIMQNTFITAWEKFSKFEGDENDFCKWACVIARYQALKHRQTQARDKLVLSEKVLEKIASEGIEDTASSQQWVEKLEDCLKELPEPNRDLIKQAYSPEKSIKAIATEGKPLPMPSIKNYGASAKHFPSAWTSPPAPPRKTPNPLTPSDLPCPMNASDRNLIELYLEGNLPADKWKEFSHRLEQSADMRREFRKLSLLDENLRAQSIGFPNLAEREQNHTPHPILPWIISAACMVACFFIWEINQKNQPLEKAVIADTSTATPSAPIAELIDFYDLQFKNTTKPVENIRFDQGKYEIESGQLHLRFDDSVELLFNGPGSFEILNPKLVSVTQGNVRTIVLNDEGKEFTILSPTSRYIDWGTEFSLNISPSGDDLVNVHEGAIEVQSMVTKNMSKMLTRFSKVTDSPEFTPVLVDKQLENIMPGEMGGNRNRVLLDEFAADPDVIGLYNFEHPLLSKDTLLQRIPKAWESSKGNMLPRRWVTNLHLTNTDASHGIFHGANRTNGRWPQGVGTESFPKRCPPEPRSEGGV